MGLFVVLEGIDGSGKTSVSMKIVEKLRRLGIEAVYTREPLSTPFIDGLERFRRVAEEDPKLVAFAMCADRVVHLKLVVEPLVRRGFVVVSDRYLYSTIAYQGASNLDVSWLRELCRYFPRPDLAIYLRVSVDTALRRLGAKRGSRLGWLFEKRSFLERVAKLFDYMAEEGELVAVDAEKPLNNVVDECLSLILERYRRRSA